MGPVATVVEFHPTLWYPPRATSSTPQTLAKNHLLCHGPQPFAIWLGVAPYQELCRFPSRFGKAVVGRVWKQEEQRDPQQHREVEANLGCLTPVLAEGVQGKLLRWLTKDPVSPL